MQSTLSARNGTAVQAKFTSDTLGNILKPTCTNVLQHFDLPALRLFCYFAATPDDYDSYLQNEYGKYFRGLQVASAGMKELPPYLRECFFYSDDEISKIPGPITFQRILHFDNLIYLRHNTCLDPTALVATFAHELQHFMQYGYSRKVWAANLILYWKVRDFGNYDLTVIDIPYEREANLISKRVAEAVCGADTTKAFAEEQLQRYTSLAKHGDQAAAGEVTRWEFFRDVASLTQYNLLEATIPLVEMFKSQLIKGRFGKPYGIDFSRPKWWI
jgi:hypothetical protein